MPRRYRQSGGAALRQRGPTDGWCTSHPNIDAVEAGSGQDIASTYRERCCVPTSEGTSDWLKCKHIPGIHQTMHNGEDGSEMEFIGLRTCKEHDQCASGSFCAWRSEGSASDLPIVIANYCSPPQPSSKDTRRSECYRNRDCESNICINSGVGFAGICLKGASEGYQKNGEVCNHDSQCASGACKDWPGAGIANERYCLGMEGDICATSSGGEVHIPQGLYTSPNGQGLNQHPSGLGNNDHDQYNCRSDYYCSATDGSTDLPWDPVQHLGYRRCTRDLPRRTRSENATAPAAPLHGTASRWRRVARSAPAETYSGYNAGDCVSNRCID